MISHGEFGFKAFVEEESKTEGIFYSVSAKLACKKTREKKTKVAKKKSAKKKSGEKKRVVKKKSEEKNRIERGTSGVGG